MGVGLRRRLPLLGKIPGQTLREVGEGRRPQRFRRRRGIEALPVVVAHRKTACRFSSLVQRHFSGNTAIRASANRVMPRSSGWLMALARMMGYGLSLIHI